MHQRNSANFPICKEDDNIESSHHEHTATITLQGIFYYQHQLLGNTQLGFTEMMQYATIEYTYISNILAANIK